MNSEELLNIAVDATENKTRRYCFSKYERHQ